MYYIKAKEGCKKVGHCATILTPCVLVHAESSRMVYMQMSVEGECEGPCV